nr:MAG: hypothetical protein DIU57_18045 [Pseudomonadota bacterium]
MQQRLESPQQFQIASKSAPSDPAQDEAKPVEYDDGLLATGLPIMISAIGVALAVAVATFFTNGEALFAVVISIAYAAVFFGVPAIMARLRSRHDTRWKPLPPHARDHIVSIYTGFMKRHEAILQMVIVPVGVAFAFAGFSLIWVLVRPG